MGVIYGTIELVALDEDGFDVTRNEFDSVGEARRVAKRWLADEEYLAARMRTIQLWVNGECVADWFVKSKAKGAK